MTIRWTPRALLLVSAGAIVTLVAVMGLLAWWLVEQDHVLERQRVQERLAHAADLAAGDLRQRLEATITQLETIAMADDRARPGHLTALSIQQDAVVTVQTQDGLWASAPLVFYPHQPDPVDPVAAKFADAERDEISGRDLRLTLAAYQRLTDSPDVLVQAGAWLRTVRVARKLARDDIALAGCVELLQLGSVPAAGRPADLIGRVERARLFAERGPGAELERSAAELERELRSGRWRLSRGEYHAYLMRVRDWRRSAGLPHESQADVAELLADGVESAWRDFGSTTVAADRGSRVRIAESGLTSPVVSVAAGAGERYAMLVATPAYVDRVWAAGLAAIADRQRALITLTSADGQVWSGTGAVTTRAIERTGAETGLPFHMGVTTSDPAGDAELFSARRRQLAGVFAIVAVLLIAGGYVAARGISKELEVARLQSDFVAAVSHEFRTPVASVRQLSEVLDEGRVTDEHKRARYYGLLRRESERLQRLVEALLDFRRMESQTAEYRFEWLDVGALVEDVAREFAGTADGLSERLVISIAAGLPHVRGDREAIVRALWNLIDNAVKYSPAATPIRIEADRVADRVAVRVRDRGPGIAAADQRRIFRKFVRGESARATGAKGTGLGLAMVSHIMRAHHGEVRVESVSNDGATFSLLLPTDVGPAGSWPAVGDSA